MKEQPNLIFFLIIVGSMLYLLYCPPRETYRNYNLRGGATPDMPAQVPDMTKGNIPVDPSVANPPIGTTTPGGIPIEQDPNADRGLEAGPPKLTAATAGKCINDDDCNIVFGKGSNKCVNNQCNCQVGIGAFCHLRPRYYKPLAEMTPKQVVQFKNKAKLEKMTLEDYREWLSLWESDIEHLPRQHRMNYARMKQGQVIYDIPLYDEVEEFFASKAASRDRVCMDIPNTEIDSPLNWKVRSTLANTGHMNTRGETNRPLNYSRYFKHDPISQKKYERSSDIGVRDWFMNNVNWLFYDIDRNKAWKEPNLNRFMNIVSDARRVPQPDFKPQKILDNKNIPKPEKVDPANMDEAGDFEYMA